MLRERKEDLSVYYFIKDLFSDVPFVTIIDAFPTDNLVIPSISVETQRISTFQFELGNRNRVEVRSWYIDVFAQNKSQRDEFGYRIMNALEECIPVYDYDEGFPPNVTPTRLGCLLVESVRLEWIRVMPQLVDKLYYRASVYFTAIYDRL